MKISTEIQNKRLPALIAVSKKCGQAIVDYDMIQDGDNIAVAVSGGKDSLSLLHVLRDRQRVSPVDFNFTAVHIDFEFSDFDPQRLVNYLEKHDFPYIIEKVDFLRGEKYEEIDCFWWSRNRRKALFQLADRKGFTKIAFGHHMDDIVETVILNQFYRGEISAMKPKQELFEGKIVIIRPLCYVREESMVYLAKKFNITSIGQSKCANDDTSQRMKIKKMIKEMERDKKGITQNIFKSLKNIKSDYLLTTPYQNPTN